jgi:DNA-binding MarR family transcriptional regulator
MKDEQIQEIRSFNRFYTNIIGLLDRHILNSSYSLIEARILFELYDKHSLTASDIITLIDIDKGYLSRTLKKFENNKLISKTDSSNDKRANAVKLSAKGRKEYELLNSASNKQVGDIFKNLSDEECDLLIKKIAEMKLLIEKGLNHE